MSRRRSSAGFRRLGTTTPEGLALSDARRRRLSLEAVWAEAVGPALSEKVRCVGIRGGVLTVRAADEAWAAAVRRLLPRIAGRLNSRDDGLQVGRVRIEVAGRPAGTAESLLPQSSDAPPSSKEPVETIPVEPGERLRAVARRMLARGDAATPR